MAAFVFMEYRLSVLLSVCLFGPMLYVLSNDVFDILFSIVFFNFLDVPVSYGMIKEVHRQIPAIDFRALRFIAGG